MKNKKLENIIDYSLDWFPYCGLYHVTTDKRLEKNINGIYLCCNAIYHGVALAIPLAYFFIKRG